MFSKWFKKDEKLDFPPEILGLRLGGAFELDDLKMRLIQPDLIIEGAATTQFIQAVGQVKLDENTTVLRFYTDDDGFIQVILEGGNSSEHVSDVKLWYFYDTLGISDENQWNTLLSQQISLESIELEQHSFGCVWRDIDKVSAPVAMTEKTYNNQKKPTYTDQFTMLYERQVNQNLFEYVMLSGEEKIVENRADRCFVTMTGFDLQPADIKVIG